MRAGDRVADGAAVFSVLVSAAVRKITNEQVHAAYATARAVARGQKSASQAALELATNFGINRTSANNYVGSIGHILRGERYRRTINDYAVNYVLTKVYDESGSDGLQTALDAVSQHIEYYESFGDARRPSLRAIVAAHRQEPEGSVTFERIERELDRDVRRAKQKTSDERLTAISQTSPEPIFLLRTVKVYVRNPDVRAEALIRANGICGSCNNQAPFSRFEDGSPYLEVHHIRPLAEGGLDGLDNVIALCPNCHREAHHGQQRGRYRSL